MGLQTTGEVSVDVARDVAFPFLRDPQRLAACVPGCRDLCDLGENRYAAVLSSRVAFITVSFNVTIDLLKVDPPGALEARITGDAVGLAEVLNESRADASVKVAPSGGSVANLFDVHRGKLAMGLVVFLICVVAAFNVVGTLSMVVRDKTREIGILLAMGLARPAIRRIFLAQGVIIGLVGTAAGAVLGFVVGRMVDAGHWIRIDPSVYFIDHLPVQTSPLDAVAVVLASFVIATLAPLYPATQAARLEPVQAIRYE